MNCHEGENKTTFSAIYEPLTLQIIQKLGIEIPPTERVIFVHCHFSSIRRQSLEYSSETINITTNAFLGLIVCRFHQLCTLQKNEPLEHIPNFCAMNSERLRRPLKA